MGSSMHFLSLFNSGEVSLCRNEARYFTGAFKLFAKPLYLNVIFFLLPLVGLTAVLENRTTRPLSLHSPFFSSPQCMGFRWLWTPSVREEPPSRHCSTALESMQTTGERNALLMMKGLVLVAPGPLCLWQGSCSSGSLLLPSPEDHTWRLTNTKSVCKHRHYRLRILGKIKSCGLWGSGLSCSTFPEPTESPESLFLGASMPWEQNGGRQVQSTWTGEGDERSAFSPQRLVPLTVQNCVVVCVPVNCPDSTGGGGIVAEASLEPLSCWIVRGWGLVSVVP